MRSIILTRDKKAIEKKVNAKKSNYDFRESLYILDPRRVQNYNNQKGKMKGTELIFFEDNPNPITYESEPKDLSETYLDDVVVINFIQQATDVIDKFNWGFLSPIQSLISNPVRIPFLLMLLAVGYIVITNFLSGGGFR